MDYLMEGGGGVEPPGATDETRVRLAHTYSACGAAQQYVRAPVLVAFVPGDRRGPERLGLFPYGRFSTLANAALQPRSNNVNSFT